MKNETNIALNVSNIKDVYSRLQQTCTRIKVLMEILKNMTRNTTISSLYLNFKLQINSFKKITK